MLATLALLSLVAAPPGGQGPDPAIRISLNSDGRFERGDRGRVKVRVADDGYLVVLHADPDGRVQVLYPLDPGDDAFVRGNSSYELRDRGGDKNVFDVDVEDGRGVILAAISRSPLRFGQFELNRHWSYDALNATDPRGEEESVLVGLVNGMVSGSYDYDVATYLVSDGPDVVYATTYVSPRYYRGYSSCYYNYFSYDCDPYYYGGTRVSIILGSGYPYRPYGYYSPYYWTAPVIADPYYYRPYGYGPYYYDPYYYRPYRRGGYAYQPYTPTYRTPSEFKQNDRTWGGLPYRDRSASTRLVNTVYDPAPVREGTSSGDAGRSPLYNPSRVVEEGGSTSRPTIERRRVEPTGDEKVRAAAPVRRTPSASPARAADRPTVEPRRGATADRSAGATEGRAAPSRRSNSDAAVPAKMAPRESDDEVRGSSRPLHSPDVTVPSPRRVEPSTSRSAETSRPEPRRVEAGSTGRAEESPRAEPRRVEPEGGTRAAPPPRVERPSRTSSSAPVRSAPPPSRSVSPSRASSGSSRSQPSVSRQPASSSSSGGRRTVR